MLERVEEPLGLGLVEHDAGALGEDLFGALASCAPIELAETDAERGRRGLFERVLLFGDADLDPAGLGWCSP